MKFSRNHLQSHIDLSGITDSALLEGLQGAFWQILGCETTEEDCIFDLSGPDLQCRCLSGLVRDLSAIFDRPRISFPFSLPETEDSVFQYLDADAGEICNRYSARMIVKANMLPSPGPLQQLLRSCGLKSGNIFEDIAALTLLETGQMVRFLDARSFPGGSYQLREAYPWERESPHVPVYADENDNLLTTFEDACRSPLPQDADSLILEAVSFSDSADLPESLRSLGDQDPLLTMEALDRACALVLALGCGEIPEGTLDLLNYVAPTELLPEKTGALDFQENLQILTALQLRKPDGSWAVPPLRPELSDPRALEEEVGRILRGRRAAAGELL